MTLENGYNQVAESILLRNPPFPVEQAMITHANETAQAVWLRELYAAAANWDNSTLKSPYSNHKRVPVDKDQPVINCN